MTQKEAAGKNHSQKDEEKERRLAGQEATRS